MASIYTSYVVPLMTLYSDGRVKCKKCNTTTFHATTKAWEYHYYHYHREHPYKCHESNCEFKYSDKRDMVKHAINEHNETLKYCDICDSFSDLNTFIAHARKNHSISLSTSSEGTTFHGFFDDLDCDKIMRQCAEREQQKMDRSEIKYKCEECVGPECKSFVIIDDLLFHHKEKHVTPAYSCPVCDYKSKSAPSVSRHVKIHYRTKFRICHDCSIHFNTQEEFEKHNRNCHRAKFKCPKCPSSYSYSSNLRQHIRNTHRE